MKKLSMLSMLFLSALLLGTSCKKETTDPVNKRKIQFVLYTEQDFSKEYHKITFTLSIQKTNGQLLWDSTLAPMQIRDIPNLARKLAIEKSISVNESETLKVGFRYEIEDVGYSGYFEMSNPGQTFKTISLNFK